MTLQKFFSDTITLQTKSAVADTLGGETITWTTKEALYCHVDPVKAERRFLDAKAEAVYTHSVAIPGSVEVNQQTDRALWGTTVLEILAVIQAHDRFGNHHHITLECREIR